MEYGVILAGGAGTRLWPLSRNKKPKQLLPLIKGKSLLRLSYDRLSGLIPPERIFVCTKADHAQGVYNDLPELPRENLLGEPTGRDTANAVGFVASILHHRDPDAVMAVVTADHVIDPIDRFQAALKTAFSVVQQAGDRLVTFGILPTHGHTGLGYIHRGELLSVADGQVPAYLVHSFKEKPDKPTADHYVESGRYYWNSGMFVWRCDTVLNELRAHLPESYEGLDQIGAAWDTPRRNEVASEIYPKLSRISIDYAVMEPASRRPGRVVTVEMPVRWLDVGSWPALSETLHLDDQDNAVDCRMAVFLDSSDNIVVCTDPNHLVSLIGISDMIVVHTDDVTMVCPKTDAQRVKELVGKVSARCGELYQ